MLNAHKLSEAINRRATGKRLLLWFLLYVVFTVILQVLNARLKTTSGSGLLSYETFFDAMQAHHLLSTYGVAGRQLQLGAGLIDLFLYIPAYTLFFSSVIGYFLARIRRASRLTAFNLLPFCVAGINLLKDAGILLMLFVFPSSFSFIANSTGYLTAIEWVASSIMLLILLGSFIAFSWQRLFRRESAKLHE